MTFFKEALKEVEEIEADRIIGHAIATRVRNYSPDDFDNFIKSLKQELKTNSDKKTEVERLKTLI